MAETNIPNKEERITQRLNVDDQAGRISEQVQDLLEEDIDNLLKNAATSVAAGDSEDAIDRRVKQEVVARPVQFPNLKPQQTEKQAKPLDFLMDVTLQISVELGRTKMPVKEVLQLGMGSVIELDKLSGEPVDILINGKLIAHGEVVVVDENFGVKIVDVVSAEQRMKSIR